MYTHPQHGDKEKAKALRKQFGTTLAERRKDLGYNQKELADLVGFEYYTMISQIETGSTRIPPDRLKLYAQALRLDTQEFGKSALRHYDPFLFEMIYKTQVEPSPEFLDSVRRSRKPSTKKKV